MKGNKKNGRDKSQTAEKQVLSTNCLLLVSRLRAQNTHAHKEHPVARDLMANHSSASVHWGLLERRVKTVMV